MLEAAHAAAPVITYHKDIAPILFEYCAPCHRPGEAGPFSLLTYADARKRASLIASVTRRRYMPPWLPAPGYGDFANERRLTATQIEQIGNWVSLGAPEGNPADAPPQPTFTPGWQLGAPDLVISVSKPFPVPADGPDLFWNFVLSPAIRQTRYVKAVEVRPGNARSVHHANLLVDRARSSRRQAKTPGEGFPGMDLNIKTATFDPDSHFLFWKPGGAPRVEPDGMAWRLDPGNDLVLNVHVHPSGKPELVAPSVGLYFTDKAPSKFPMLVQFERDRTLDIAAGNRDFVVSDDFRLPIDVDVFSVYPHAHYLGTLLEAFATLPDGSRQWLIRIPQWDINWQSVYHCREPLFLPKGTVISMRYHYDNSADNPRNRSSPPRRVRSGNQSTDEMGHLWLQVLPRGEGDQRAVLQEALMRHRLENDPANASAHFNLGVLLLGRKDAAGAIGHLRDAVRLEPAQPMAWNDLGAALQAEGKVEEALEQFRSALRIDPDYGNARFNLANGLAAQGKLTEAAANLRQVIAAEPEDVVARERLAAISNQPDGAAAAQFEAAPKADPPHQDVRRNLEAPLATVDRGPRPGQVKVNPKDGLRYVWIPPGTFAMGCSPDDYECFADEKPAHQVTITRGYWMGQTAVTVGAWKQYRAATAKPALPATGTRGRNNLVNSDDNTPVASVTWSEARDFCGWAGNRLPTEAEWEYAARAGNTSAAYGSLETVAWYGDNSGKQRIDSTEIWRKDQANYAKRLAENGNGPHPVGQKAPNAWNLYDMLGNVWQWTADWYDAASYGRGENQDPMGPPAGQYRILRGGSWYYVPRGVRVSGRLRIEPELRYNDFGFRCAGE